MAEWIIVVILLVMLGVQLMDRRNEREYLQSIREIVQQSRGILRAILQRLGAQSAHLTFVNAKGETLMPATIVVGGNGARALFEEFSGPSGTGVVVPPIGPVVYASDAPSVATVDASGNVVAVAAGTANISALDQGNGLTASDALTVTAAPPPKAASATLSLTANP